LNKVGAPFDVYSFNDIDRVDMSQYKLFVFPATFKMDNQRMQSLQKHVLKDGKTALFMYAPAIINEHSLDVKNVKKFVGVDYASKGVQEIKKENHNLVYIHNYDDFNVDVARNLAEKAGVLMVSKKGDVVYGSEKFLSIHSAEGGKRIVKLPFKCKEVVEAYTKKIVGENCTEVEIELSTPDTILLELNKL
jgi:hypothetical protein